ncbi:Programmed cell death protein 4 [Orchesella cincta]|uniref:Programmed cell death protein 4 n=1 Tax=Orchesella cincta TaxID=48709 RepID=A0A1D2N058_ORCCI|nr:Programmed cell death protein 4 [Orchesella cincta]
MDFGVKLMNGSDKKEEAPILLNGDVDEDVVEVNGIDEGSKSPTDKTLADAFPSDRIKRKAKRLVKHLAKDTTNGSGPIVTAARHMKNSRKPRNGFGRGLPKKGGAGGKGTWGAYGSEMNSVAALDYKDPNYDSESLDNGDIHLEAIIPEMTDDEIQKNVESIILEYFEHGDAGEVIAALEEMNVGQKKHKTIVIAVEAAMDHKPSHREMTSVLISEFMEGVVTSEDVAKAFEILLGNLPDLILDAPDAATILGNFIARAVADDCISVGLVHSWKDMAPNEHAKAALTHAEVLLADKIAMLRLHNVWGVGGGGQPVRALSKRISMLLKEYLSSNDATEAGRCLRELEVPHFHHELVYEAIVMALESMQESVEDAICRLLKSLFNSCLVTPDQMMRGFVRVFEDLPDICIDLPPAYSLIDRFVTKAQRHGCITDEVVRQVPIRGRKRFVSEGDGGKVKEDIL